MAEKFNFNLDYRDYIILENDFTSTFYDYKEKKKVQLTLPKNLLIQVENVSMGGQYKTELFIVFKYSKTNNKHISEKLPSKFKVEVYDLNGMEYTVFSEKDYVNIDKKINSIMRKSKIENLLSDELL